MNTHTPAVTVAITCFNSQLWIAETIRSVLRQTVNDWELVIVNHCSTDLTEEIIKEFKDPRIRYEYSHVRPLSSARNRTIELARADYVACLDHDDLWEPQKLEVQMRLFEQNPNLAMVYSDAFLIRADGERFSTYFDSCGYSPFRGRILEPLLEHGNFIPLLSVVVRKDVLKAAGGFDVAYRWAEDYDAWLRVAALHEVDFVAEPLGSHRRHESNSSDLEPHRNMYELLQLLEWGMAHKDVSADVRRKIRRRYLEYLKSYAQLLNSSGRTMESVVAWSRVLARDPRAVTDWLKSSAVFLRLNLIRKRLLGERRARP